MNHLLKTIFFTIVAILLSAISVSAEKVGGSGVKTGDMEVTGTNKVFTLTFSVDGEEVKSMDILVGTDLTYLAPAAPVKEGFTFVQWRGLPSEMPAENLTVTAQYRKNSYKVTFAIEGETPIVRTMTYGATITLPKQTKEGCLLVWETDYPKLVPAHDVVINGRFVPESTKGDVNGDGRITMADANAVVDYLTQVSKPKTFNVENADADGDGSITMKDARKIVDLYLGNK